MRILRSRSSGVYERGLRAPRVDCYLASADLAEGPRMTILADSPTTTFTRIEHFNTADAEPQPGRQLDLVRAAAAEFRQWFAGTGTPEWIGTFDLSTLPYPTRFGLFRAALSPPPFPPLTHRLMVIRGRDPDGRPRLLLFEPTDVELARRTPYFARLSERTPGLLERMLAQPRGDVLTHLRRLRFDSAVC